MDFRSLPRRRHSAEFRSAVLAACKEPGASVAAVALAHGLNANLVHDWRRREAACKDTASPTVVGEFVALPLPAMSLPQAQAASHAESPLPDIRVDLRCGPTKIVVSWPMAGAREFGEWLREWLK